MIYSNEHRSNIFYKEILDNYDKEKQLKILEKLINIIITNENNNYFYSEEPIKEIEQEYIKNQGTFYNLSIISSSNNTSSQNFNSLLSNHFLNNNTSSKESSDIYDKEISNNSNNNNNNYNFFNDSNPETTISNRNNFDDVCNNAIFEILDNLKIQSCNLNDNEKKNIVINIINYVYQS